MYIVLKCVERELDIIGYSDHHSEAKRLLKSDFEKECDSCQITIGEIDDCDYGFCVDGESAWLNDEGLAHANYDWKIIKMDEEESV